MVKLSNIWILGPNQLNLISHKCNRQFVITRIPSAWPLDRYNERQKIYPMLKHYCFLTKNLQCFILNENQKKRRGGVSIVIMYSTDWSISLAGCLSSSCHGTENHFLCSRKHMVSLVFPVFLQYFTAKSIENHGNLY